MANSRSVAFMLHTAVAISTLYTTIAETDTATQTQCAAPACAGPATDAIAIDDELALIQNILHLKKRSSVMHEVVDKMERAPGDACPQRFRPGQPDRSYVGKCFDKSGQLLHPMRCEHCCHGGNVRGGLGDLDNQWQWHEMYEAFWENGKNELFDPGQDPDEDHLGLMYVANCNQVPLLQRQWTHAEPAIEGQQSDFRVVSFNMLADSKQGAEEWAATPPEALEWSYRGPRLLEEILGHNADILCLQELDHVDDFFFPGLSAQGYSAVITKRPEKPDSDAADSVAVFFRNARFELCGEDTSSLDYAAVACLKDRNTGAHFVTASAHLEPGKDAVSEGRRAEQAKGLLDLTDGLAKGLRPAAENAAAAAGVVSSWQVDGSLRMPVLPSATRVEVLISADLNAVPQFDKGIGDPLAYTAMKQHGLHSAYTALNEESLEPPYTTWKLRAAGVEKKRTIDYIFYSDGLAVSSLLNIPSPEEMPKERIPNFSYPSDHFSLAADIHLK